MKKPNELNLTELRVRKAAWRLTALVAQYTSYWLGVGAIDSGVHFAIDSFKPDSAAVEHLMVDDVENAGKLAFAGLIVSWARSEAAEEAEKYVRRIQRHPSQMIDE